MRLENKKILVTGAGGFIGSHLTEELVKIGADVDVFLRYNSNGEVENLEKISSNILRKVKIKRGDLRDVESVKKAMEDSEIVFHLGALISIPYSIENPRSYVETNVLGTFNILEIAKERDLKKIIITSTSEVYGTAIYPPIKENHPLQAQSPYAASKISADKFAESFSKCYKMPIAIIRPFNSYGPRQSMRAVIPTIIYQALTQDTIRLGSLTPQRDFTYVKDTVRGFIKTAESENSIGETINIGSGKAFSVRDIVKIVGRILGKDLESIIVTDETKIRPEKGEVKSLLCDNKKAKDLIGWEPFISFEDGLRNVVEYIHSNIKEYKSEVDLK